MPTASDRTFEESYVELFVRAARVAGRIVRDRSDAEDIAAETMARAMVSWSRVRTYSTPWVTRVATNLAIDVVRRRKVTLPADVPAAVGADEADRVVLLEGLRVLPKRQREALVLRYLVGLSAAETAEVLGVSPGTAKTHIQRGVTALKRQFAQESKEIPDVA